MVRSVPFYLSEDDPPAKQSILTSALALFASRGIDGVSIRDIAADSGFTNPAMFKYYTSKDDLAFALFEACYRRLVGPLIAPGTTLRSALAGALDLIETSPESVHFVLENLRRYFRDLPESLRSRSLLASMRRFIGAEQKAGRVRGDVDPQLAAALVLGMLAQIARMAHFDELSRPASTLVDEVYTLLERGIGG